MSEQEWKQAFEPAKEGEKPREGVWVPNRAYRRAIKKNGKKIQAETGLMPDVSYIGKGLLKDPEFRSELYEALYKDFMKRKEEKEKELYGTGYEGSQDPQDNE